MTAPGDLRRPGRYLGVGVALFVLDAAVFFTLSALGLHLGLAQIIARGVGAATGFFAHRRFTFEGAGDYAHGVGGQAAGYVALTAWNLAFSPLVLLAAHALTGHVVVAKACTEVVVVVQTYILMSIVFRRSSP